MSTVGGVNSVNLQNIQGMDLETAMMAVQSSRANVLEGQLKSQMEGVQARNDQISRLNTVLSGLNKAAATFGSDASAGTKLSSTSFKNDDYKMEKGINDDMKAAGLTNVFTHDTGRYGDGSSGAVGTINGNSTKSDVDAAIATVKSQIDAQSNSQQMDMLRLQSLSNKRNEAFDLMTNFVKKMADSRSSVLGNMR